MTTTKRVLCIFGLLAVIPLIALAETLEERFERSLPFSSGQSLAITNTNGSISVVSWGSQEIEIVAKKKVRAGSDEEARKIMAALEIDIEETGQGLRIKTRDPKHNGSKSWFSRRDDSASVSYTIRLPESANLDLETVNGKIMIEGVRGDLELSSTNGGIKALESGGSVRAHTTNGGIEVELSEIEAGEEMSFKTTNGGIEISLPGGIAADLSAGTTNGSIETDFPITIQGSFAKNRLSGSINGGGPTIELRTTNGSIRIREI